MTGTDLSDVLSGMSRRQTFSMFKYFEIASKQPSIVISTFTLKKNLIDFFVFTGLQGFKTWNSSSGVFLNLHWLCRGTGMSKFDKKIFRYYKAKEVFFSFLKRQIFNCNTPNLQH